MIAVNIIGGFAVGMLQRGLDIQQALATYTIPSAAELPSFETAHTQTPTPLNPLGVKGIGEAATIGSMPAVQNAVIDALSPFGVRHLDPPLHPERIWRARHRDGRGGDGSD